MMNNKGDPKCNGNRLYIYIYLLHLFLYINVVNKRTKQNRFHKILISNAVANNIMYFRILFVRPPNLHWQLNITK